MSQKKLLLADDSITIQKVVNLTFADEGIEVVTVGDGDAALAKWTEFAPDLILADVNMPGLNGYQLCEKIKQSENGKKIPVILLVGSFEPFDEEEAKRVGADDFLTKPFQSIRQLIGKVTDLLESTGGATSEDSAEIKRSGDAVSVVSDVRYDDAGMDDEMIQTNAPGGFAFDEAQKFETHEIYEPAADSAESHSTSNSSLSYGETGGEQNSDSAAASQTETEISAKKSAGDTTGLEFDDDFLELPDDFDEDWEGEEETGKEKTSEDAASAQAPAETAPAAETMSEPAANKIFEPETAAVEQSSDDSGEDFVAQTPRSNASEPFLHDAVESVKTSENSDSAREFSSQMIEAVAQRVIEKLSDKIVREIAWEVVPQLADLIVKKMAEEKFKE